MRVIPPSATYLDPDNKSVYELIELAGRTCYKSEENITPTSALAFVKRLAHSGHFAMLEHGIFYFVGCPINNVTVIGNPAVKGSTTTGQSVRIDLADALGDVEPLKYIHVSGDKMSLSLRTMRDLSRAIDARLEEISKAICALRRYPQMDIIYRIVDLMIVRMAFSAAAPEVIPPVPYHDGDDSIIVEVLNNSFLSFKTVMEMASYMRSVTRKEFIECCEKDGPADALAKCVCHTVQFTTDRGVTHELVRHRPCSFAQESTRYCNYSKGKYGSEITVVMPAYYAIRTDPMDFAKHEAWKKGCKAAEDAYMAMLEAGATAQEARAVLPQSVKADIIVTANEEEWKHILSLRLLGTTGVPHPDMRFVMRFAAEALSEHSNGRLDLVSKAVDAVGMYVDIERSEHEIENAEDKDSVTVSDARGFKMATEAALSTLGFDPAKKPVWLSEFLDYAATTNLLRRD